MKRPAFSPRQVVRYILLTPCLICAILLVKDHARWLYLRTIWAIPEDARWYRIDVTNDTWEALLVNVCLVNDRQSEVYDVHEAYARARLGRISEENAMLAPGETRLFSIPSEIDAPLGVFMVTAIGKIERPGSNITTQKLALRMLTSPPPSASNSDDALVNLQFRDSDLITLTLPYVSNWYGSILTRKESEGLTWVTPEDWGEIPPATEPPPAQ